MFKTRPEINGTFGVVTSTHWLATAAGMSILEKGGNAFPVRGWYRGAVRRHAVTGSWLDRLLEELE